MAVSKVCLKHLMLCGTLFASGTAVAQSQVPTRDQLQPPPKSEVPASQAQVDSSGAFERGPCPLPNDLKVNIRSIEFASLAGKPLPKELEPLLKKIKAPGDDQPVSVVCEIRDQANASLRGAHYVASIQIPPQKIEDGILRLEVITAHIVEMRVRGDPGPYAELLSRRIEKLKALDPLNDRDAERILLNAGDIPGLGVTLTLRPAGGIPGDVIGDLTVDYAPITLIANLQNFNSKQLGRETGYIRAEINGITGNSDMLYIGVSTTADFKEQQIAQIGYLLGLGDQGTTVALRGTFALSKPDLDTLRLTTRSYIAGLDVTQPLIRSVSTNAIVAGGFEFVQQKTVVETGSGSAPLNLDRIAALFLRGSGNYRTLRRDGSERISVSGFVELRKGLRILNATRVGVISGGGFAPSRFEGDAQAFIARGQVDAKIGVGPIFELATQVRGQYANNPLLNFDEFSVGNLTIGRGYDPGSNSGDRAIAASFELRANVLRQEKLGLQLFGFYDTVRLWNLDRNSTENDRMLRSYGGGARVILPRTLIFELTYARPRDPALLSGGITEPPPGRILASVTAQIFPFNRRR